MIVFAGFTPHSPLLLSSISKDLRVHLTQTRKAMYQLSEELYASRPDVILLVSEHPTMYKNAFSINLSDPYDFDLRAFGDLGFRRTLHPAIRVVDRLQRSLRKEHIPFSLTTDVALHYASAIPLGFATKNLDGMKIIPVTYSDLDLKQHFQFGQAMRDELINAEERIAVLASGDLSHALTNDSPATYHEFGAQFDARIQDIIATKNIAGLLSLPEEMIMHAQETATKPLSILFGILDRIAITPKVLSYEAPFGVGYIVSNFELK